jgi:hypothetical protein
MSLICCAQVPKKDDSSVLSPPGPGITSYAFQQCTIIGTRMAGFFCFRNVVEVLLRAFGRSIVAHTI